MDSTQMSTTTEIKATKIEGPVVDETVTEFIVSNFIDNANIRWNDISGQQTAKEILREEIVFPTLRPDLFSNSIRCAVRGFLLFGPPGNGRTMLAKAVANELRCKFLNINARRLTCQGVGKGQKLLRAIFQVAREIQPAIIFIDDIDHVLCGWKEDKELSIQRLKTEFFVEFEMLDKFNTKVFVIGATNRPKDLCSCALRRFYTRIYVKLPDHATRKALLKQLLSIDGNSFSDEDLAQLASATEGYSGSDLNILVKDAALGPIRELNLEQIKSIDLTQVRSIQMEDFQKSLKKIRPSVSPSTLASLEQWDSKHANLFN